MESMQLENNRIQDLTDKESHETAMTEKQRKAYDEFIDYMVELYTKYGHLLDDTIEQD